MGFQRRKFQAGAQLTQSEWEGEGQAGRGGQLWGRQGPKDQEKEVTPSRRGLELDLICLEQSQGGGY